MLLLLFSGGVGVPLPSTDIIAPTNLTLVSYSHLNANLSWTAAVRGITGVDHYRVYINGVWDNNEVPYIMDDRIVTYYLNPLTPNTSYSVYVTAVDQYGVASNPTNTINFTTPRNSEALRSTRRRGYYA